MSSTAGTVRSLLDLRTWVAFDVDDAGRVLAGHDELGTVQLVEIAPDGSRTALTALPSRCSGRYVPGRRQVVVQHDTDGDELMQLSLLDLGTLPSGPVTLDGLTPLVRDRRYMHVLQDVTADSVVFHTNRRNGVDMDVVVRDLTTGDERVVHDGGGYVVGAAVSHDEASIAVTGLSLRPASTLVRVSGPGAVGDGAVTDPDEHARHTQVAWAPEDEALLMESNHDREFTGVARVSLDGRDWSWLVTDEAHDLRLWASPSGRAMVVGTVRDGAVSLAVHDGDGAFRCPVRLPGEGVPDVVWAADEQRVVVTLSTPTDPASLHLVDAATGTSTPLARVEVPDDVRALLVAPSVHRVPTPDGEEVPCFRYSPAEGDTALDGASVLHIHGGPESASMRSFSPVVQALCAAGLTVLVPNVRGSTTYGKRWYSLDDVRLRRDSVADLAAIHRWLPTQGLDPERSALWGGSYGGYMVLAGVAMQPERWAAGVDIVGMSSLVTFLENTSPYRVAYREREYGSLTADRDFLESASPITYLDDIVAPLFVIHGANDPRVPLSEAEQIRDALRGKGVDCELRVYHDEGHGLAKRENRQDAYPAAIGFLRRHLAR
ncbi:alpha/beta fold hydrolase [Georgenia sp. H159]|uniref:S9 family peptidase n=1 Tax=Georgenia sp. H159 TaxID=3076115 RepID=UPI002D76DB7E|nr:alpha/beta fold hydrolase [Georgenia sp. H159]